MRDAVKSSFLAALAEQLETVELGAAVRILVRLLEKPAPLPEKTIHLVAGVDKEAWSAMSGAVLAHFSRSEKGVVLKDAVHPIESVASKPKMPRKGATAPLFPEVPKGAPRPESLPAYLASRPSPVTMRKAIYDTGIRVLMAHGNTEKIARAVIAGWLKAYSEGAVAEVISDAQRRPDIDDPHAWIVARLRASARGVRIHPGMPSTSTPLPRAKPGDMNGMSDATFAAMKARNEALRATRLGVAKVDQDDEKEGDRA